MWSSRLNFYVKIVTCVRTFVTVDSSTRVGGNKLEMTLKPLNNLSEAEFKKFLNSFDTVLADCDGVLWLGDLLITGAREVMNTLKAKGKRMFYVTNNSTKTRQEFVNKFRTLGFNATQEEVVSTAYLAAAYLNNLKFGKEKSVYIVGSKGISQELDTFGIKSFGVGPDVLTSDIGELISSIQLEQNVGAVVVGFDEHFSFPKMMKAATYLNDPAVHFVATNTDERFPHSSHVVVPGAGTFVTAVRTCAGRDPVIVGKPEAFISEAIIANNGLNAKRTLMIGDRCNTDILLGTRCGFQTLLVLSGVTKLSEVQKWKDEKDSSKAGWIPDYYISKLGDLLNYL